MSLSQKYCRKLIKEAMKTIVTDQNSMKALVKSVAEHLNEKIDEILKRQQKKCQEYDQKISSLSDENKSLRQKPDKQEQYQIKNNIRIYEVEESDGEIVEDVEHNLLNKTLKVKMNVGQCTEFTNRVGPKNTSLVKDGQNKKPRAILVRFSNSRCKQKVMDS
ncbi:hypothetical protein JTB14_013192 [Gonioctena quinquepunctata]|nr:hypothetical protein JTB14_013192 [Gonioctena quinquepunctata]